MKLNIFRQDFLQVRLLSSCNLHYQSLLLAWYFISDTMRNIAAINSTALSKCWTTWWKLIKWGTMKAIATEYLSTKQGSCLLHPTPKRTCFLPWFQEQQEQVSLPISFVPNRKHGKHAIFNLKQTNLPFAPFAKFLSYHIMVRYHIMVKYLKLT